MSSITRDGRLRGRPLLVRFFVVANFVRDPECG
jgi:hypothetical protein